MNISLCQARHLIRALVATKRINIEGGNESKVYSKSVSPKSFSDQLRSAAVDEVEESSD